MGISNPFKRSTKRIAGAIAGGLVAAALVTGVSAAAAAAQPAGGSEHFTIITTSQTGPSTVIATGAFHAVGTVTETQISDTTSLATFTFPNGTFEVSRTDNPGGSGSFNNRTCVGRFSTTGVFTILSGSGTGSYAGISGQGTYSSRGTVVSGHTPSGCSDTPIALSAVGRANGTVWFS